MSDSAASLRHKIASAGDLESVVRTMKAIAASSIGQYERAVDALGDYDRAVQLGLAACLRQDTKRPEAVAKHPEAESLGAVVFGSDQGLVGQFNDVLGEFVTATLSALPGEKVIWAIGERIRSRLADKSLGEARGLSLPNSINAITPLVGQILIELQHAREHGGLTRVYLFHNRPQSGAIYGPVSQRLLPLDAAWQRSVSIKAWPTNNLPEVIPGREASLDAFIREYLFVSLFRACAESLASENASRLAAMQRAEKNIGELLEALQGDFHRLRQLAIDEELFDVIAGFEALSGV